MTKTPDRKHDKPVPNSGTTQEELDARAPAARLRLDQRIGRVSILGVL